MTIGDDHREFGRAVVALAREHHMDNLSLTFRRAFGFGVAGPADVYEEISLSWSQGRHGDKNNIRLQSRASQTITETKQEGDGL